MAVDQEKLEFIRQCKQKLRDFLLSTEPVASISVAGMSMSFSRKDAWDELKRLEQEETDLLRGNRRGKVIDLRNAF